MKIYRYITTILWQFILLLFLTGCIRDEVKDCDDETCIRFSFVYDYNLDETDLFAEQVDHITLFIYTEDGRLEETLEVFRTDMEPGHTVSLMLPPGRHMAVAWGNAHTENYRISGTTILSGHQSEMTCIENQVITRVNPGALFHASNTFDVVQGNEYTVPMSLVKNSNTVRIIIKGLGKEEQAIAESLLVLRLLSNNWSYHYDNSVSSDHQITYLPEYTREYAEAETDIEVTFYPLRLFTYDEETMLMLRYRDPQTGREAALERPLIPYLLNQAAEPLVIPSEADKENEYLDRRDMYELIFVLEINADGEISFEEWDRINQEEGL